MSRIQSKFEELKQKGETALIAFVTAGDPSLSVTEKLVYAMEAAGADLIELGIPFSDPMADGPVIQRSSERALKAGTTLSGVINLVQKIRKKSEIPLILMGYFNPILQFGCARFCRALKEAGVDGLIIVDLPVEESDEIHADAKAQGIDLIYLLTPTSHQDRIAKVGKKARGFLYYVSMTGVTGAALNTAHCVKNHLTLIKKNIHLPVCIGFGIHTEEQAQAMSRLAEGVVVGSALVSLIENSRSGFEPKSMTLESVIFKSVAKKVKNLKQAILHTGSSFERF